MLSQTLVSTTQVPEPPGHDFTHTFPQALENNDNRMTDTAFSYDPNGNLVRFKGQQQQAVGARWDANNRMQAFVEGDPWTSAGVPGEWYRYDAAGQRWFRMGRDGKVVLTLRDEGGQALSEFVETPTSGGPVLKADFVYGLGKLLVERKVGVAPPEMAANSPLTSGTNERFLVTSGAGAGSYTVDIAAPSGYRNRVAGVTLDAQGRFTLPESALSPLESNAVRVRKDGQVGSGYSAQVSVAYDPAVTATSPNPVRALSIHWASNNLVVRWSLAQDTGKAQRLFFRSSDGLTTVLLTPTALPSSVLSYTLASQALSAPCGALHLETLEVAASPMAGLPSADAGEQGIDTNPCPGGGSEPPDPPAGPAFVNWYHHRDHLGTLRNVTDEAGYVAVGYDDYPYGARMPQSATPSVGGSARQFTGHERDLATGLDYMGARYYSSSLSRFLSTDPIVKPGRNLANPQRWNQYVYSANNPLKYFDPDGKDYVVSTKQPWTVSVTVNVVLVGKDFTPAPSLAATFESQANAVWGGGKPFTSAKDGQQKTLDVKVNATADPSKFSAKDMPNVVTVSGSGKTEMTTGDTGTLNTGDLSNPNVVPHEVGHMVGMTDQYDPATGQPNQGAEGTLMGDPNNPSATLTQGEVDEAGNKAQSEADKLKEKKP